MTTLNNNGLRKSSFQKRGMLNSVSYGLTKVFTGHRPEKTGNAYNEGLEDLHLGQALKNQATAEGLSQQVISLGDSIAKTS